jgi:hypothetical protein
MSIDGRVPAVSDSTRTSDTTPSIAENTYPSLLPMMSTGSPAATVDELPRVTAVGRAAVADGSNLSTAKSWDTS